MYGIILLCSSIAVLIPYIFSSSSLPCWKECMQAFARQADVDSSARLATSYIRVQKGDDSTAAVSSSLEQLSCSFSTALVGTMQHKHLSQARRTGL